MSRPERDERIDRGPSPPASGEPADHPDTIAAISTAPGPAALAVVRLSGPDVPAVAERLIGDVPPVGSPSLRWLHDPGTGEPVDQVVVTLYRAPRSYTGEDMLELSCHGGTLAPQLVLDAALAAGARPAAPGAFTRRAYLNGKLDLLQAEAILDLVEGRSTVQHRVALHQLDRGLSKRIEELREAVVACEALLVYEIDFPEEDEGSLAPERVADAARDVLARIDRLLDTADQGEMLREGALSVIAGRPNTGKSSLFNALCGSERVIVTEEPGTTRDAVEALISLDGYPFRLVDTAGLREGAGRVERIGIEVARRYLASADLVLFCVEAGRPIAPEEAAFLADLLPEAVILVRTKADLAPRVTRVSTAPPHPVERRHGEASPATRGTRRAPEAAHAAGAHLSGDPVAEGAAVEVPVSTLTAEGLADLRARLIERAFSGALPLAAEGAMVTRRRHARALRQARDELSGFLEARSGRLAPEVAATHLRAASEALEELLGVVAPEEVLTRVFSEFCIGK